MGVKTGIAESQMKAVEIGINLSSYIISAVVSLIGVVGGVLALFLTLYNRSWVVIALAAMCLAVLIFSVYFGGKGIDRARRSGHAGNWELESTKSDFNRQAVSAVVGLLFFFSMLITGLLQEEKPDKHQQQLQEIQTLLGKSTARDEVIAKLEHRLVLLENKLQLAQRKK